MEDIDNICLVSKFEVSLMRRYFLKSVTLLRNNKLTII